jgi:hypothetical protein
MGADSIYAKRVGDGDCFLLDIESDVVNTAHGGSRNLLIVQYPEKPAFSRGSPEQSRSPLFIF